MRPDAVAPPAFAGISCGLVPRTQPLGSARVVPRTGAGESPFATGSFVDGTGGR